MAEEDARDVDEVGHAADAADAAHAAGTDSAHGQCCISCLCASIPKTENSSKFVVSHTLNLQAIGINPTNNSQTSKLYRPKKLPACSS